MTDSRDRPAGGQPTPQKPEPVTPSEIARQAAGEAAAAMKDHVQGKAKDVEPERSGQLSPPHTPGRRGR